MHLEEHLRETGQTQGEFGKSLHPPVSQGLISQWIRGVTRVTLDWALQIEAVTEGKVTCQDCADMYVETSQSSASATPTDLPSTNEVSS